MKDTARGSSEASRLMTEYEISPEDLEKIRRYGKIIIPKLPDHVTAFYQWLKTQPDLVPSSINCQKLIAEKSNGGQYNWPDEFTGEIVILKELREKNKGLLKIPDPLMQNFKI